MEKKAYFIFEDHEDFQRALEEVLQDRKEYPYNACKSIITYSAAALLT